MNNIRGKNANVVLVAVANLVFLTFFEAEIDRK
jgi:hypothetical protein